MKLIEPVGHQGDTQWYLVDPKSINLSKLTKIDKAFIAQSERTGSVHALCGEYEMYTAEAPFEGVIIETKDDCVLNHSMLEYITPTSLNTPEVLPKKDHPHSKLPGKKIYFAGIHRKANLMAQFEEDITAKVRD